MPLLEITPSRPGRGVSGRVALAKPLVNGVAPLMY